MHGEPSWSYLYRKMIPRAGRRRPPLRRARPRRLRPVATSRRRAREYTYARHVEWMREALFDHLDLSDLTLVGQDWGGLIGLRLVGRAPRPLRPGRRRQHVPADRRSQSGQGLPRVAAVQPGDARLPRRRHRQGRLPHRRSTTPTIAAYDAPFPDDTYKEGARQFPLLVPTSPDDPAAPPTARRGRSLQKFDKPFLCAFSDQDPITGGADRVLKEQIPGTQGQPHTTIEGGGHFLQEDRGRSSRRSSRLSSRDTSVLGVGFRNTGVVSPDNDSRTPRAACPRAARIKEAVMTSTTRVGGSDYMWLAPVRNLTWVAAHFGHR